MIPEWILDDLLRRSLLEDVGNGDLTTELIVPAGAVTEAIIHSKESGVLAGIFVASRIFKIIDPHVKFDALLADGDSLQPGDRIALVRGNARAVLTGERLALNFLQHLSGVATATRRLVRMIEGTGARLVDTRKTLPGLRALEKYAVRAGGGCNHRFGLYDGILIKDNHIKVAGGIREAVKRVRASSSHMVKVEVEVEDLEQVKEALDAGADIIMLDNMPVSLLREAVKLVAGRVPLEASGGISQDNIREVAETGVDYISVGSITHSAPALDISMDVGKIKNNIKTGW